MGVELVVVPDGYATSDTTRANITTYSVSEESTPLDGSDSTGGVGELSFTVTEDARSTGSMLLYRDDVELVDSTNGKTLGKINSLSASDGEVAITAASRLSKLVAEVKAQPFIGSLDAAFRYYFGLADIRDRIVIDPKIGQRGVLFRGFAGNLWDYLKQLCVAHQIEIALVSNNIVVRKPRQRVAEPTRFTSTSWGISNGDLAQRVKVSYYNNRHVINTLVYPEGGWSDEVEVLAPIDAGQVVEETIETSTSITDLVQPVCLDFVPSEYRGPLSVYCVIGNDGLPIEANRWVENGGKIEVRVGEVDTEIIVKITASKEDTYSPYRIATASNESDGYSSLRIVGSGVHMKTEEIIVSTGATKADTATDIGVEVENPFIRTAQEAWQVAYPTAARWGNATQTISIRARAINNKRDNGVLTYLTWDEFDALEEAATWTAFESKWLNETWQSFEDYWTSYYNNEFSNQAFGNLNGARVKFRDAMYRIRSATTTEMDVSFTAEADTTFEDVNNLWTYSGKTWLDYERFWDGMTWADADLIPLRFYEQTPLPALVPTLPTPTNPGEGDPTNPTQPTVGWLLPSTTLLPSPNLLPGKIIVSTGITVKYGEGVYGSGKYGGAAGMSVGTLKYGVGMYGTGKYGK